MANDADAQTSEQDICPGTLATTLADMARKLAEIIPNVADGEAKLLLGASLDGMRTICSSLRSIDLLYDPDHARQFIHHAEGLRRLALTLGETVGDLTAAGQQVSTRLNDHVQELQDIAESPSGSGVADRLRATVAHVQQMAAEMNETFDHITHKVSSASQAVSALEGELKQTRERALVDALTHTHSRAALDQRLDAAIREGKARGPWAFLLIGVDHFGRLLEDHGQIVGDALLFKAARTIEGAIPKEEGKSFLARFGGDEFALVLAQAQLPEARSVADGVRKAIATTRWQRRDEPERGPIQVTVSVGLTEHRAGDTVVSLVRRAEATLQKAKSGGRNTVVGI